MHYKGKSVPFGMRPYCLVIIMRWSTGQRAVQRRRSHTAPQGSTQRKWMAASICHCTLSQTETQQHSGNSEKKILIVIHIGRTVDGANFSASTYNRKFPSDKSSSEMLVLLKDSMEWAGGGGVVCLGVVTQACWLWSVEEPLHTSLWCYGHMVLNIDNHSVSRMRY